MIAESGLPGIGLRRFCRQLFRPSESIGPIGFDLGLEKLNMVQVHRVSGQPVIHAAASEYHDSSYEEFLADPRAMQALIGKIWKSQPFQGRRVVSSLPGTKLRLIFLNYAAQRGSGDPECLAAAYGQWAGWVCHRLHADQAGDRRSAIRPSVPRWWRWPGRAMSRIIWNC